MRTIDKHLKSKINNERNTFSKIIPCDAQKDNCEIETVTDEKNIIAKVQANQ